MKNLIHRKFLNYTTKKFTIKLKDFAEFNPDNLSNSVTNLRNFVNGQFLTTKNHENFPCPLTGKKFLEVPLTKPEEMQPFMEFINSTPRSGLHNPLKNVDRYIKYGEICRKIAECLNNTEIMEHFVKLIQKVFPKTHQQAFGEMKVTRAFFENFSGDNVNIIIYVRLDFLQKDLVYLEIMMDKLQMDTDGLMVELLLYHLLISL